MNLSKYGESGDPINGSCIILGGEPTVVGCWGGYEIDRRALRDIAPEELYVNRTYVGADDVIESVVNSRGRIGGTCACPHRTPLAFSLKRLERALSMYESHSRTAQDDYFMISPTTSFDVVNLIQDQSDLNALNQIVKDVCALLNTQFKQNENPPRQFKQHLPNNKVNTKNKKDVRNLEVACLPYIMDLEKYQGQLAAFFESAANKIELSLDKVIL
jgi:hypothetical protein